MLTIKITEMVLSDRLLYETALIVNILIVWVKIYGIIRSITPRLLAISTMENLNLKLFVLEPSPGKLLELVSYYCSIIVS